MRLESGSVTDFSLTRFKGSYNVYEPRTMDDCTSDNFILGFRDKGIYGLKFCVTNSSGLTAGDMTDEDELLVPASGSYDYFPGNEVQPCLCIYALVKFLNFTRKRRKELSAVKVTMGSSSASSSTPFSSSSSSSSSSSPS